MDDINRVDELARHLCAESGGDWERKGTRKAYWRELAADQLAALEAPSDFARGWRGGFWQGAIAGSVGMAVLNVALMVLT